MAVLLLNPNPQFCDADGDPYAGGTLATLVPGTTTPKATWSEPTGTALNTQPIVLDAAGRCLMWGDGDYRLVLRDVAGNVVFDQPSSTIVSAAMQPVVIAPTLADARVAMGIDDAIAADVAAWNAAIATEAQTRATGDTSLLNQLNADIANEATTRASGDASLQTALQNEINRATAAEAALAGGGGSSTNGTTRAGHGTADSSGNLTVSFVPAFPNGVAVALLGRADPANVTPVASATTVALSLTSWSMQLLDAGSSPISGAIVYWYAIGW